MGESTTRVGDRTSGPLVAIVYPGADGNARLYEDAGDDEGYRRGVGAWTGIRSNWTEAGRHLQVAVSAVEGTFPGIERSRGVVLRLPGSLPPQSVEADGVAIPAAAGGDTPGWAFDGERMEVVVRLAAADISGARSVDLAFPTAEAGLTDGIAGILARLRAARDVLETLWPDDWPADSYVALSQTGRRIELHPETAVAELEALRAALPGELDKIRALQGDETVKRKALAILVTVLPD
jgi:hypothetical protein